MGVASNPTSGGEPVLKPDTQSHFHLANLSCQAVLTIRPATMAERHDGATIIITTGSYSGAH